MYYGFSILIVGGMILLFIPPLYAVGLIIIFLSICSISILLGVKLIGYIRRFITVLCNYIPKPHNRS
jgi:hypothetical protein